MAKQISCELKPALYAESFHRVVVQIPFPEHYSCSMTNKNFKKEELHFITSFWIALPVSESLIKFRGYFKKKKNPGSILLLKCRPSTGK